MDDPLVSSWLGAVGTFDATELPGLDDLHSPTGAIREAQELAAECFGADRTYFLVGGSTVGNLAMIGAVCKPGDIVLMQRNAHKSAVHALMLAGGGAVFLPPHRDAASGLYTGPSAERIDEQLRNFPEAKAVFVTNPNYYGMSIDLRSIAETAHKHGKPLLVDEAHGAHFGLHPKLPASALQCGADVVVQSTHKMLPAMTMGAMLHVQGGRVDARVLEQRLRMLQSSSPSYPILASLDWARSSVHGNRREGAFRSGLEAVHAFRNALKSSSFRFGFLEWEPASSYSRLDPFKVAVYDKEERLSGFRLQAMLAEHGCDAEMADERHVLLVFGLASSLQDAVRLKSALEQIELRYCAEKQEKRPKTANNRPLWPNASGQPVFFDMDGVRKPPNITREPVEAEVEHSAGALSAEMVVPYPPGIPLLYPGEPITPEAVTALIRYRSEGASVQGIRDETLTRILVWHESGI